MADNNTGEYALKKLYINIVKCLFWICLVLFILSLVMQSIALINLKKSFNATFNSLNLKWHNVFGKKNFTMLKNIFANGTHITIKTEENGSIYAFVDKNYIGICPSEEDGTYYTVEMSELKNSSGSDYSYLSFVKSDILKFILACAFNAENLESKEFSHKLKSFVKNIHPVSIKSEYINGSSKSERATNYNFAIYSRHFSDFLKSFCKNLNIDRGNRLLIETLFEKLPDGYDSKYRLSIVSSENEINKVSLLTPDIDGRRYNVSLLFEEGTQKIEMSLNDITFANDGYRLTLLNEEENIYSNLSSPEISLISSYDKNKHSLYMSASLDGQTKYGLKGNKNNNLYSASLTRLNAENPALTLSFSKKRSEDFKKICPLDKMSIKDFFKMYKKIYSFRNCFK